MFAVELANACKTLFYWRMNSDSFFMLVGAVTVGNLLTVMFIYSMVLYSRGEEDRLAVALGILFPLFIAGSSIYLSSK